MRLAGQRDPGKRAELRDWRIRASKETIMKSLVGDYREEHIFTLGQSLKCYRHYQNMIEEVDRRVKGLMQQLPSKVADGQKPPKEKNPRKTPWRNEPPQLRDDLYRAFGVDLTQVPGINTLTAQMLLTEVGPDLSRFPTAAAFCSWLRLCPNPQISGGQVLSSMLRRAEPITILKQAGVRSRGEATILTSTRGPLTGIAASPRTTRTLASLPEAEQDFWATFTPAKARPGAVGSFITPTRKHERRCSRRDEQRLGGQRWYRLPLQQG